MAKYGLKEVADVIFFDIATGKPVLFFDSLKTSSLENTADSTAATGGRGNGQLVVWNYGRKATLKMQDALLSPNSIALLSGNDVSTKEINLSGREVVTGATTVNLTETAVDDKISVWELKDGVISAEVSGATVTGKAVSGLTDGKQYMVFYEYKAPAGTKTITFSTDKFPGTYRVVGDTVVKSAATGKDHRAQFLIKKAQLKAAFNFTMEAENVSTFDFELEVLRDDATTDLYTIAIVE